MRLGPYKLDAPRAAVKAAVTAAGWRSPSKALGSTASRLSSLPASSRSWWRSSGSNRPGDELVVAALRATALPGGDDHDWYRALPPHLRAQLTQIEFLDLLGRLREAGIVTTSPAGANQLTGSRENSGSAFPGADGDPPQLTLDQINHVRTARADVAQLRTANGKGIRRHPGTGTSPIRSKISSRTGWVRARTTKLQTATSWLLSNGHSGSVYVERAGPFCLIIRLRIGQLGSVEVPTLAEVTSTEVGATEISIPQVGISRPSAQRRSASRRSASSRKECRRSVQPSLALRRLAFPSEALIRLERQKSASSRFAPPGM